MGRIRNQRPSPAQNHSTDSSTSNQENDRITNRFGVFPELIPMLGLDISNVTFSEPPAPASIPGPSRRNNATTRVSRTVRNSPGGSNTQARAIARLQRQATPPLGSARPATARPSSRNSGDDSQTSISSGTRRSSSRRRRRRSSGHDVALFRIGTRTSYTATANQHERQILDASRGRRTRVRPRSISFDFSKAIQLTSQYKVMNSEKFLKTIFAHLTWRDLIFKRRVCHKWQDTIFGEPNLKSEMSKVVIAMNKNVTEGFKVFNNAKKFWTQYRITANTLFDLTQPVQSEFWWKHGPGMTYLELRNSSMTLASLVEILKITTDLVSLTIAWTPEMYSFNADMIKRYYGITFRNSTFHQMKTLKIEHCSSLTDNALGSLLKWCGSSLNTLALTSTEDEKQNNLGRHKPKWTIHPIEDFATRFGYSGNLKFLDFSGSNLIQLDLVKVAKIDKLTHLTGIRLSRCNINDEGLLEFLKRKGEKLEELYIDYTSISENVFQLCINDNMKLPKLQVLDISGTKNFTTLSFLGEIATLDELYCFNSPWLNKTQITKVIQFIPTLKKLNLGFKESSDLKIADSDLKNIWFNKFVSAQNKLSEVNLNFWGIGNDVNFKLICKSLLNLNKLSVRGWHITDESLTGVTPEDIAEYELKSSYAKGSKMKKRTKPLITNLKRLEVLDLGQCESLTDTTIHCGLIYLPNLRSVSLKNTQITDNGLQILISNLNALYKVNASGCERVTIPKRNQVQRQDETVVFYSSDF